MVEEVVVTARKREENAQDVPIAIAAFSAEKLDAAGVESAQGLTKITPGLVFANTFGYYIAFLRGIGSEAFLPSADPSVPIYVDDINQLAAQGSIDSLVAIERVEVLKGPQGTLFGRNALGGAIRIITPEPDESGFFGELKLDRGQFNLVDAEAISTSLFLNLPIVEGLAATVSGTYRNQEPIYTNDLGGEVYDEELTAGRIKLKWWANEDLAISFAAAKESGQSSGGLTSEGANPYLLCAVCSPDPEFDYHVAHNTDSGFESERTLVSARMDWTLPAFNFIALASDQELIVPYGIGDLDYTSSPLFVAEVQRQFVEQKTLEMRIESNADSPWADHLVWVAGMYYLESAGGYDPLYLRFGSNLLENGLPLPITLPTPLNELLDQDLALSSNGVLETESLSAFAEGTVMLPWSLDFSLGLRYDTESRNVAGSRLSAVLPDEGGLLPIINFEVPEATTERVSPRVSLKWNFDQGQIYTSYAVGYLSPTYNTVNFLVAPTFVDQEEDRAYELGFKGSWLDDTLSLEGALFYTERKDIITAITSLASGGAVNFYNGGDGKIKGAEISAQIQPLPELNPGLALIAGATYLDAKYENYADGRGFDESTGLPFGPDAISLPARDFSGNDIVNTPDWTASATVVQYLPLPDNWGALELAADVYYNAGSFFSAQNTSLVEQPSFQLIGARLAYFYDPYGLQITLYGENLTDERFYASAVNLDFGPGRTLAPPRKYGVRAKWSF
ncbi:TonB-dependent receptor [Spongiibacter taiwanensis]|uniref:TonB-dependent receptor n=1 Tax=Spongiibacter taiwanensis TaxID=1748242 RepID=UPI002034AC81|nr:TonB-dependent receptor [Spongiibacter taiwanensis]USA42646.1 TonB-dependent receptor [Spongiibacter taiwanensis]